MAACSVVLAWNADVSRQAMLQLAVPLCRGTTTVVLWQIGTNAACCVEFWVVELALECVTTLAVAGPAICLASSPDRVVGSVALSVLTEALLATPVVHRYAYDR